ncbi:MAG: kelch repeat-containing protein [Sulfobacillus sp.]
MKIGKVGTAFLLGSLGSLLLAGCGGSGSSYSGGGSTPPPTASVTSVAVSCASATVNVGQTSQCSATVQGTGSFSSAVSWAVNSVQGGNATAGTVSTAGLYTAPSTVPTPFTVALTATSVTDTTKSASSPVIVAGTIASVSQTISASAGGTIALPDGSSVTIAPGILSADTTITLSKVSVPSSQPNNPAIGSVGPALVLGFSSPAHFLFRSGSGKRLATPDAQPGGAFSSSLHFVINVAGNISASLTNSVPMASLIGSANGVATNFVGAVGSFDATAQTVTGDVSEYALQAASTVTGLAQFVVLSAQNFIGAKLQTYLPQNSWVLNVVPSNPTTDTWVSYSGCPTGKTLLVVHGMDSSIAETYPTKDSTILNIKESGGYDSVVGYDYDWTNAIDTSGAYIAAFLNTLAQCPGVSIDVEAHSEGVAVTLSALTDVTASTRQKIPHVIAVAGPIMGTPMANQADLAAYFASQPGVVIATDLLSEGLAYVLSQPFVNDLVVSSPGDNSKLDIIRRTVSPYSISNAPQIFVVAGDVPGSMQKFADMMSSNGVNYSDGFIPLSSALAFQNNSSNLPVLKVYPLPPFPGNHIQLIGNSSLVGPSVAHAVGVQINTSATSPTLSLSSIPSCTNSIVCSGTAGTYFSLGGSDLTNADNYALYQQDDTGNVTSPPFAANFIASNATVPPNTWQDTPPCGVAPHTLVLFAQDTNSNSLLASNAVTEQVIAGGCAPAAAIAVSPSTAQVPVGGHQAFTATVTGLSNTAVTWSVNGSIGGDTTVGTISSTGSDTALYTAPATVPSPTMVTVTATSQADAGVTGSASVTIEPSGAVTVSPASVVLAEGGTQQFTATVSGGGTVNVNWSVQEGTTGGTITNTGLYTAPDTTGTFHVVATNATDSSQSSVATVTVSGIRNEWTWMSGANTLNAVGVYGTQGVPAASNVPGARYGAVSWTDSSGNLWLFGGFGNDSNMSDSDFNDLWEFNPTTKEWTWVSGANTGGATGVYGTQGVPAAANVPGARDSAVSWIDSSGNLWLFGGVDSAGSFGPLNDLWKFNPSTSQWTWMGGSSTVPGWDLGQPGVYGTQGVPAATNVPGARQNAVSWTDSSGNLWLFGGLGADSTGFVGSLNDLWEFNPNLKQWIWMGGSSTAGSYGGQPGVYGTQGVASATNVPGARESAVSWIDSSGNLWLFGGGGFDPDGSYNVFNDLWEFNPTTKEWTWVSGSNTVFAPGVYGTQGVPAAANVPGARQSAVSWIDSSGNLWLFGGGVYDLDGSYNDFNDLWEFNPTTKEWTWMSGANTGYATGVYGTQGVPAAANVPEARWCAVSWIDSSGNLWLFGGQQPSPGTYIAFVLNDLWRYQP